MILSTIIFSRHVQIGSTIVLAQIFDLWNYLKNEPNSLECLKIRIGKTVSQKKRNTLLFTIESFKVCIDYVVFSCGEQFESGVINFYLNKKHSKL